MVVWFVCSGWGSPAVVHAAWMAGEERKQVAHSHIHKQRCDWWVGSAQSFFGFGRRSALRPLPNPRGEFLDVIEDFASLGHFREDLLLGVHHCRVVAAERLTDLRQ
jgi:hypothetical protein